MKESWTDDRLDDFRGEVNRRFDKVDARMDRGFGEVNSELKRLDSKLDGLQRTMVLTSGGIIATLIAGIISLLVTQV